MNANIPTPRRELPFLLVAGVATGLGLALRFVVTATPLWLDEAQSVAIADGSFAAIDDGLRRDGHPPLYYWLLHVWARAVGDGDGAIRLLSTLFGIVAVALVGVVAHRSAGRRVAIAAVTLAATSPFLVRYATEARMYALVTALSAAWWLAGTAALRRPVTANLVAVAITTGALVLTHYWSFFLVAGGGALVLWRHRTDADARPETRRVLIAGALGGLAFVPWIPAFLTQLRSTGTPWAVNRNPVASLVTGLVDLTGGRTAGHSLALFAVVIALLGLGVFGRARGGRVIELDLSARTSVRPAAALAGLVIAIGLAVTALTGSAFASRYFAVVVAFLLVVAARGVATFEAPLLRAGVLAIAATLGLLGAVDAVSDDRSQGREVAQAVELDDSVRDLVVACPDQLGPATARYLDPDAELVVYPTLEPGELVDWTDYAERNAAADPARIAIELLQLGEGRDIWLVWRGAYRTFGDQCERLLGELAVRRGSPATVVAADPLLFEPMNLVRYPAPGA